MNIQHSKLNNKRFRQLLGQNINVLSHCTPSNKDSTQKESVLKTAKKLGPQQKTIHSLGLVLKGNYSKKDSCSPQKKIKQESSWGNTDFQDLMCREDELSLDKNETQKFEGTFFRDQSETVFTQELFQQHSSLSQMFNDKVVKQIEVPQLVEQIPCYIIDPHYLLKNVSLDDWSRARLINWMMVIGNQMHFNRWTVHLGVEYFDRFFSKCKETFSQMDLQDYSLIVLSVAAKQNEVKIPNVSDFIMNASQSQTSKQLIEYEVIILNKLQWNLHPYTHIQQLSNILLGLQIFCQQYRTNLQFLQYQVQSTWFEGFMNDVKHLSLKTEVVDYLYKYLELFLMDAENLIYPQKTLCLGLVYVALGLDLSQFDEQNLSQMKNSSRYLLSENSFNQFFAEYLKEFGIEITEILCSVQYVSGIFNLVNVQIIKQ